VAESKPDHAHVVLSEVPDPQRYGVVEFSPRGTIDKIEEKPKNPKSNYAVTGIYIYPPDVFDIIKTLKPSKRGELEITDVNNHYIQQVPYRLGYSNFVGYWTDAGTPESWGTANELVKKKTPVY